MTQFNIGDRVSWVTPQNTLMHGTVQEKGEAPGAVLVQPDNGRAPTGWIYTDALKKEQS